MSTMVRFERLPTELIHKIFHYLQSYDIFLSFYNINGYTNTIINTYDRYQLNFQSITLSNFDFILHHINPCQVISLTLSNLDDTSSQFQSFLSSFAIKVFSRLQSLRLIQPSNPTHLNAILSHLHTLDSLRTLAILHCQPTSVNQQTFLILSSFLNSSTTLNRLSLAGTLNTLFEYPFLSSINHLYFNDNIFNTIPLSSLTTRMPYLKSLDTAITLKIHAIDLPSFLFLTRLTLTIFIDMKSSDMENLLNPLSNLIFLKIIANGKQWFNGHFWEECLPFHLRTFQFNFCTQSIHIDEKTIFQTFQTDFWMHRKHWYVMLDYQMNPTMTHLYSLPYCDTQFYYRPTMDPDRKFRSSIPIEKSYLDNVTSVTVDLSSLITESNASLSSPHFFSNISTLILADSGCHSFVEPVFYFLKSILDFQRIVELKLGQFHHPDLIEILYKHLPRLYSLRIPETTFTKLEMIDFSNIFSLTICDCVTDVEKMYAMFPYVKNLCIKLGTVEQMQQVMKLYDQSLRNVTFRHINHDIQEHFVPWLYAYYGKSRRFFYDIDQHMNLHMWLGDLLLLSL